MKKSVFIFTVLSVSAALSVLTSCRQRPNVRVFFDREKFFKVKNEWKEQNLKNYSFSYKMYISPYYMPLLIKGNVTVKDGKGSVTFEKEKDFAGYNRHPDYPIPREGSHYHITCMEDIFNGFYESYLWNKDKAERDINFITEYYFSYDEKYFYITKADGFLSDKTTAGMIGNSSWRYNLKVFDFKISE